VGRGIALELGAAGVIVYITGRTVEEGTGRDGLAGSLARTSQEVMDLGGVCIPIQCDHRDDAQVQRVFDRVAAEHGRLDILVNNVWGGYESMAENGGEFTWGYPFWKQPLWRWDAMFAAGVRAHYVASVFGAGPMVAQRSGLIVTISFWAARKYEGNVAYGVAKAADDKLVADMAHELRAHGVAAVSLYPGIVRTEDVMRAADYFDLSNSESPEFTGRAVTALAGDPEIMYKSGKVLVVAALAQEYGFTDVDGRQPRLIS
jgi:NAD(P)-dependent dehydrogenase (short-subunit alcohol dehydrogenase family)